MEEKNKYSILMSVYYKDREEWLKQSIESMLNQTIKTDDFVIIKDGKLTKELEEIINTYKEKEPNIFNIIQLEENKGLGIALSIGIKECKNEWIARMDSDDISMPNRVEKQMKIINKQDIDIIGSNIAEFIADINNVQAYKKMPETDCDIKKYAKRRNPFAHPSEMLKKDKILESGNFRDYYLCEDYDMWLRMIKNNAKCYNIQENLVYMRVNQDFYKKRGGIKYLKSILKLKTEQYRIGFFSLTDYALTSLASIIICLLPNKIRETFYKKFLRKWKYEKMVKNDAKKDKVSVIVRSNGIEQQKGKNRNFLNEEYLLNGEQCIF